MKTRRGKKGRRGKGDERWRKRGDVRRNIRMARQEGI